MGIDEERDANAGSGEIINASQTTMIGEEVRVDDQQKEEVSATQRADVAETDGGQKDGTVGGQEDIVAIAEP